MLPLIYLIHIYWVPKATGGKKEIHSKGHKSMASSNFNPTQQSHFSFNPPCKYQSPTLVFSNLRKHKTSSKNTTFYTNQRQFRPGCPSVSSCFNRVDKKSKGGAVVEEDRERKNRKYGYVKREIMKSGGKREMGGSDFSPLRPRDERVVVTETKVKPVVDEQGKKNFERSESSCSTVGDGNMVNNMKNESPKKANADSLRLLLDMCSKRGDVLGAISLYDSACREGIELGQHHCTVLLYLCSSAAAGIVHPAKSGRGNRSINKVNLLPTDISSAKSVGSSENCVMGNLAFKDRMPVPALSDEKLVKCDCSRGESSVLNQNEQFDDFHVEFSNEGHIRSNQQIVERNPQYLHEITVSEKVEDDSMNGRQGSSNQEDSTIQVSEDVKRYALKRGFEIYESMCLKKVPINEASLTSVARMAMAMGDGNMAFDMVKQMKTLGIKPRLRSYGPALLTFCKIGDLKKAFMVEQHMLENGVYPEEPELEALLRLSVEAGSSEKVYYLLHKLRTSVRKVSSSTADLIERWFRSIPASRVGKRKWDQRLIMEAMENGGGGWHGKGWLGRGKWTIIRTSTGTDGVCEGCGEKLVTIDLDPTETQNFAKSVASIASQREKNSSFLKFQEWLDYHGPFEAVIDAANVGLFNQRRFVISKVNAIANAIRQKLPSKKWPLIVVHNKRITGRRMDEPANRMLLEKWKTAEALYLTPTGSNDDWYWLYAAIKFKCLIVTNDEMRDHIFQLLGNDFFPRWKERHQVRFSFRDGGPELHMPPPCSVVIQESEKGYWHIPVVSEHDSERERTWLCATRANAMRQDSKESHCYKSGEENVRSNDQARIKVKLQQSDDHGNGNGGKRHQNIQSHKELYKNLRTIMSNSPFSNHQTLVSDIEAAEKLGGCIIDFQI